jgi:hypothetical protein
MPFAFSVCGRGGDVVENVCVRECDFVLSLQHYALTVRQSASVTRLIPPLSFYSRLSFPPLYFIRGYPSSTST